MKRKFNSIEDVNNLSEIQALKKLAGHPNVVALQEVLFEEGRLAIVFELMDMNGFEAIKDRRSFLPEPRVAKWMGQMAQALYFMHKSGVAHRDIKPENLLLAGDVLKLADLGSCTSVASRPPHTEYISTRWYRSPETLLTSGYYTPAKMDIWAFACVFYELMALTPLFPGKDELDQVNRIHGILGTPSRDILASFRRHANGHLRDIQFPIIQGSGFARKLSHCSTDLVELLNWMLTYNPEERPTSRQLLKHPYFQSRMPAGGQTDLAEPSAGQTASAQTSARSSVQGGPALVNPLASRTITNFQVPPNPTNPTATSTSSTGVVSLRLPAGPTSTSHLLLNSTSRVAGGGFGLPPISTMNKAASKIPLAQPKFKKQPAFLTNNPLFSQTGLNFLRPLR
jgi:renal tumor antigen